MDTPYEIEQEEAYSDFVSEISERAIQDFTQERLRSYYIENPGVMRPAIDSLHEGIELLNKDHYSAALVFLVTSIELFLKVTVLQPVVRGLVHSAPLSEMVMKLAVGQTGFDRYSDLLSSLYFELSGIEISTVRRSKSTKNLLDECKQMQKIRNSIIHRGGQCAPIDAKIGVDIAVYVFEEIVRPMLSALKLRVIEEGKIVP